MAINKTLSDVRGGADLLKPQLNATYIVAATVGIVVLLFVWQAAGMIYAKGSTAVQSHIPGATTPDFKTALGIV